MVSYKKGLSLEVSDLTDNLGRIHILILFMSGVIWGFLAVNNQNNPDIFKIALIYAILLLLGLIGIGLDHNGTSGTATDLGLDSKLWSGENLSQKLGFAGLFCLGWYLFFLRGGFAVAVPQAVSSPLFSVSDTVKFILVTVLGPLAENIFFFGVVNFTLILFFREAIEDRNKSIMIAVVLFLSTFLFSNIPMSKITMPAAAIVILISHFTRNDFFDRYGPVIASALVVGGNIFPSYHGYAYQLNEQNYVAAAIFGILMCLIGAQVGMLVVDIAHTFNNVAVLI